MNSNEPKIDPAKHHAHWRRRRLLKVPFVIATLAVLGGVVMGLWNALIPELFHGPLLNYGQALGLFVLAKLLFGFGGGRGMGHRGMGGMRGGRGPWMHASPEEIAKMRDEAGRRWGKQPTP